MQLSKEEERKMKKQRTNVIKDLKGENMIPARSYKTPKYLRDSQAKHNAGVDKFVVDFPLNTKTRMRKAGISCYSDFIRSAVENKLKRIEKKQKKAFKVEEGAKNTTVENKLSNLSRTELISIHSSLNYFIENLTEECMEAYHNAQIHQMEEDRTFFRQMGKRIDAKIRELKEFQMQVPKVEYTETEEMMDARFIPLEELKTFFEK